MKNILLLFFGLTWFVQSHAQMPLPCTHLANGTAPAVQSIVGDYSRNCIRISDTQVVWDGQDRRLHGEDIEVAQDFHIDATDGGGGNFVLDAHNRGDIEGAWFFPANSYLVPLYEKVEWGLKLPSEVMDGINNFIINDSTGSNLMPSVNPFDDEQIDVVAEIRKLENGFPVGEVQPVYGFFYREYEKIWRDHNPDNLPDMDDPDNWRRNEIFSEYKFRIRWSPAAVGIYEVTIKVNVPGIGQYSLLPFQFEATWNDPKKSFISVTPNGKYFQTADGEVFFPVGQNLHAASCECDNLTAMPNSKIENPDCETCYDYGSDDPCCGLDTIDGVPSWAGRSGLWGSPNPDMERKTEPVAAYQRNLKRLEDIKAAGANTVRMHMWPVAYEFEFEKLNNYYDRLFMASELDWYFDRAHELNMRVDFCMQFHMYYIQHGGANLWDFTDIPLNTGDVGEGYCYHTQSDLTDCTEEPYSFFEKANARKYFKKKLRYLFARYGYSSAFMCMEFWSEQNNLGNKNDYKKNTPDTEQINLYQVLDNTVVGRYDSTNFQIRKFVAEWNAEMVDYIKDNLKHHSHPIGTHYTGTPMWTYGQNCTSEYFDDSWMDPSIDFIGYSSYDQATDRYSKWTSSDWGKFGCDWWGPNYYLLGKPVFHLEQGPGGIFNDEDYTFFEKDLWCNGFSGFASSGFPWGRRNYEPSWNMFGNVREFFETEVFPLGGFTENVRWSPNRSLSNEQDDKERLEAVYLRYNDPGHQKAVGIVMNRLWNPATTISTADPLIWNGDPLVDDTPLNQWKELVEAYGYDASDAGDNYTIYYPIDYSDSDEPKIDDMGFLGNYLIKYYNPYTLQVIHTSNDVTGPFGELRLKEVPMLNFPLPYVLFKIERNSDVNMPTVSTGTEHLNDRNTGNSTESEVGVNESNLSSQDACSCQFYPNPVENFLQINCSMSNYTIEILDAKGRRFLLGNTSSRKIDFENLSAGVYSIKVTTETCVIIRKIVKI